MKTITFLFALLFSFTIFANDGKYIEAMSKQIDAVYKAQSPEDLQNAVNAFDRIANAEKTKWEPFYYSAFGNVMLANRQTEATKKDSYLDLALASIEKAKAINSNESEIIAMEGFIHMIRVTVDPASRGQQYSGLAMQTFGKAVTLNPENPRALSLLSQMQLGTARFFGSSTDEACATAKKSVEKFTSFKSENPLAPRWGKSMADAVVKQCEGK